MKSAYVREKLAPDLERRLAEKGFVVLFWGDGGWVRLFTKNPGMLPRDFKTMKIFVTANDVALSELYKTAGFHPVLLEWADVLTSLQTGIVDAVPTIPFHALRRVLPLNAQHAGSGLAAAGRRVDRYQEELGSASTGTEGCHAEIGGGMRS